MSLIVDAKEKNNDCHKRKKRKGEKIRESEKREKLFVKLTRQLSQSAKQTFFSDRFAHLKRGKKTAGKKKGR